MWTYSQRKTEEVKIYSESEAEQVRDETVTYKLSFDDIHRHNGVKRTVHPKIEKLLKAMSRESRGKCFSARPCQELHSKQSTELILKLIILWEKTPHNSCNLIQPKEARTSKTDLLIRL